jgi:hypothetical protein
VVVHNWVPVGDSAGYCLVVPVEASNRVGFECLEERVGKYSRNTMSKWPVAADGLGGLCYR